MITLPDGRRLRVSETAPGPGRTPVVVAECGLGDGHGMWAGVAARVGAVTRFVAYDRAGLGGSDPDPRPRTARRMAQDLADLLDALRPGPFVLVGHSIGGPVCRLAAAARPDDVVGMVLVDPAAEDLPASYTPAMRALTRLGAATLPLQARIGRLDRLHRRRVAGIAWSAGIVPGSVDGTVAERRAFTAGLAEVRDAPPTPPRVPVTVLSAGTRPELIAAHERYAAGLPDGRHVLVAGSGHDIHLERPALVAEEIRRMLG
ncbi:alpha/beta fold hydrolase [Pseudonocardia lacus]|uniref:alpha/beta fold hydrolase n=1 Tax=Pseudonocardia lacus TaxID=2835865 RepID=UPI0027E32773|nr:alpha/beta hydrolase [Pseudonocardia lacus]